MVRCMMYLVAGLPPSSGLSAVDTPFALSRREPRHCCPAMAAKRELTFCLPMSRRAWQWLGITWFGKKWHSIAEAGGRSYPNLLFPGGSFF
jgi:hypothetical protein